MIIAAKAVEFSGIKTMKNTNFQAGQKTGDTVCRCNDDIRKVVEDLLWGFN